MLGDYVGENAAAHVKLGSETHEARIGSDHQIVQDTVGDRFVEGAFVTEGPDVKLQAFELHTALIRDVIKEQGGEIRLAGLGAQASELGDFHMDVEITSRLRVVKSFEGFAGLGGHVRSSVNFSSAHYTIAGCA